MADTEGSKANHVVEKKKTRRPKVSSMSRLPPEATGAQPRAIPPAQVLRTSRSETIPKLIDLGDTNDESKTDLSDSEGIEGREKRGNEIGTPCIMENKSTSVSFVEAGSYGANLIEKAVPFSPVLVSETRLENTLISLKENGTDAHLEPVKLTKVENEQANKTNFSVASWYLYRTQYEVVKDKERAKTVTEYISTHRPNIVILQNVDRRIYEEVVRGMRSLDYNYRVLDELKRFAAFDLFFSLFPIHKISYTPISASNECQFLLTASITIDKKVINVCTGILENAPDKIVARKKQWSQMFDTKDNSVAVIGMNTHITTWQENDFKLPENWSDAWKERGEEEMRYTLDCDNNMLVQSPIKDRPDRILFTNQTLKCESFCLIDSDSDEHPSDHLGILAHFELL